MGNDPSVGSIRVEQSNQKIEPENKAITVAKTVHLEALVSGLYWMCISSFRELLRQPGYHILIHPSGRWTSNIPVRKRGRGQAEWPILQHSTQAVLERVVSWLPNENLTGETPQNQEKNRLIRTNSVTENDSELFNMVISAFGNYNLIRFIFSESRFMVPTFSSWALARWFTFDSGISRTWLKKLAAAVSTATMSCDRNKPFDNTTSDLFYLGPCFHHAVSIHHIEHGTFS